MIVVVILAVLGAIAIPIYNNYISSAKQNAARTVLEQIPIILESYRAENGNMCPACNADGTYTYGYTETDGGVENFLPATNRLTVVYPEFTPKAKSNSSDILYHYNLQIVVSNCATDCNEVATITAVAMTSRGAPSGDISFTYQ